MTVATCEQLLALDPETLGKRLTGTPESQWFERKSGKVSVEVFARALIGMANAEGGCVVVGVSEGKLQDLAKPDFIQRKNALMRAPQEQCVPPVFCKINQVIARQGEKDCQVLIVEVPASTAAHDDTKGECFLRSGDSTFRLSAEQRFELRYDRGIGSFEARESNFLLEDLDEELLGEFVKHLGAQGGIKEVLSARNLLTRNGKVTVAAALLFAKNIGTEYPDAEVRVLKYLDDNSETGSFQNLDAQHDVFLAGPILRTIPEAIKTIDALIPQRKSLSDQGTFIAQPIIPKQAWMEAVVNAIVHRSYSYLGDYIRVSIFPNRIEVSNPGRFPNADSLREPTTVLRYARNPRIARVCGDFGYVQELGEGIRRIYKEIEYAGLVPPTYQQTSASVTLILRSERRISPFLLAQLPDGAEQILELLQRNKQGLGTGAIASEVAKARPTVLRVLRALEQHKLVRRIGKSERDPRAVWQYELQ